MNGLGNFWSGVRRWFAGKKQILGGVLIIVAGVAGVATKALTIVDGVGVVGFGLTVCGHAAKSARQHSEILAALTAAATAGVDLRLGDKAGAIAALKPVVMDAAVAAAPELALHISGSTAAVLDAVSGLTVNPNASDITTLSQKALAGISSTEAAKS